MTRRGLFGIIGAALAGATLDPERLLWVPGKKLISIPKPGPALLFPDLRFYAGGDLAVYTWDPLGPDLLQGPFEVVMPRRELRELHEVVSVWHGSGLWKL